MNIQSQLELLGLSTKEIKLYLALVELGKSSISTLCRHCSIPRTTAYPFINKLCNQGLITKELLPDGGVSYSLSPPHAFLRLIDQDQELLTKKEKSIKELIEFISPHLQGRAHSVPKLQFVEGKRAVENLLYISLPQWKKSYERLNDFSLWGYQDHTFVNEYRRWHEHAWKSRNPKEKIFLFSTPEGVKQQQREKIASRSIRPLPQGFEFPCSIWIRGDHILFAMTRFRPHYAVLLVDTVISQALKTMFMMLWQLTKTKE